MPNNNSTDKPTGMMAKLMMIVRAFFSLLSSPMVFCEVLLDELSVDAKSNDNNLGDVDALFKKMPIVIIPLTEFERLGCSMDGVEDVKKRFVLMHPLAFNAAEARGIGQQLEHLPEFPDIRLIPDAFVTDFASIPFGSPYGSYNRAAVVHDWAYSHHHDRSSKGRDDCDMAMLSIMRADGTSALFRAIVYVGLYIGGEFAFQAAPEKRAKLHQTLLVKPYFLNTIIFAKSSMMTYMSSVLERYQLLDAGWTTKTIVQMQRKMQGHATPNDMATLAELNEKLGIVQQDELV